MRHQTLEQLRRSAVVHTEQAPPTMTKRERLERWASLLEREPGRRLATLPGTEYQPANAREAMRALGSPVTVAFEDPIFRAQGMKDDSYGEAKRFFAITDRDLHNIVCYCHHGDTIASGTAARIVRAVAAEPGQRGLFARFHDAISG